MPADPRWFSTRPPFTPVVECLRALLTGTPVGNMACLALARCTAIALADRRDGRLRAARLNMAPSASAVTGTQSYLISKAQETGRSR